MNSVPNHSETSVSICVKCGAGAPTERNDKMKMVCFKVCAACEEKSGDASQGVKRRGKRDKDTTRQRKVNDITEDVNSVAALDDTSMCAACGKSDEGINLKWCNACKMVKYCNRECQIAHRPKHKQECRQRAWEIQNGYNIDNVAGDLSKKLSISDDKLFQEPPAKEDCPICLQPIPYTGGLCGVQCTYHPCCGKLVCTGCTHASSWAMGRGDVKECCIFCRSKDLSEEEELRRCKERMNAGHAETFDYMGHKMFHEQGNIGKALDLWSRGAKLGNASSHHSIADVYLHGKGVEKDDKKAQYHLERAAIGGHEMARYSLGINEYNDGNMNRAMKHFMMAARTGYDESLKQVEKGHKWGIVEKDEYESTLSTHKVAQDEMKSNQRMFADRIEQARKSGIGPNDEGMKDVVKRLIADGLLDKNGIVSN